MKANWIKAVVFSFSILTLAFGSANAQVHTSTITGTVLDPTGAVIPGAEVTVTNQATGVAYRVTTDAEGAYRVPSLPAGFYSVEIEVSGFRRGVVTDIKVDAGLERSVKPIRLEVGQVAETVVVEGGAELVNTTSASVGTTVERSQIESLPLLNRNPLALLDLQAGVNNQGRTNRVINGQRTSYSNVTLDGVNIQDNFIRANALDFLPNLVLINQVNEFSLISQSTTPQYGFAASQVSFSSPSGSNEWHGDVFWYHRNNKFAASDWFANARGDEKPKLVQNQAGFGIGGPIVKNKLFIYSYYELFRNREAEPQNTTVLTSTARNGIFRWEEGGVVHQFDLLGFTGLSIDPFVADLLTQVPTTINNFDVGDSSAGLLLNTGGFGFNQGSNRTRDNYGFRLDWTPSAEHSIFGSWQWNRDIIDRDDIDATFNESPVVFNDDTTKFLSATHRWSPSPRFTNEFRGGFNLAPAVFETSEEFGDFVISGVTGETFIFTNPIEDFRPQGRFTDTWSIQDNASYTFGTHTLSFGGMFQQIKSKPFTSFNIPPTFDIGLSAANPFTLTPADLEAAAGAPAGSASSSDAALANDLLASLAGFVEEGTAGFNVTSRESGFVLGAPEVRNFTVNQLSFYVGDSWRARSNLTVTYGLRWEYDGRFDEDDALTLNPIAADDTTSAMIDTILDPNAVLDFAGCDVDRCVSERDLNNLAPHIGIAWDPWGDGKTAIRAGYSISYVNDEIIRSADNATTGNDGLAASVTQAALVNTISGGLPSFSAPTFKVPRDLSDQIAEFGVFGAGTPGVIFAVDPRLKIPYVQQWNLSVEREVGWDAAVEVRYMGNRGVQLTRAFDLNQIRVIDNGFLEDFRRARVNGFLCEQTTGTFDPSGIGLIDPACANLPGNQTLTIFPNLPFFGFMPFFGGFFTNLIRTGEVGDYAFFMHGFGPLFTGNIPFGDFPWAFNPSTGISDILTNFSTSDYHAGVVEVRRRPTEGVYFQANYTFSKALTDSSGCQPNCLTGQTRFDPFLDINQPELERTRADFDLRHQFKLNFIYDIPMGEGYALSAANSGLNKVISGWRIGSIVNWQSGAPFSILSNRASLNRFGRSVDRNTAFSTATEDEVADLVGVFVCPGHPNCPPGEDGVFVIDPAAVGPDGRGVGDEALTCQPFGAGQFCNPLPGQVGNLQRRAFSGPKFFNWDFSIIKDTKIDETRSIEFRAEFFNLFNHPTFFTEDQDINSTSFGKVEDTLSDRRIIQFGLRFRF